MPHDRIVAVSDVGWVSLDGLYMVTWSEDGVQQTAFYREEASALHMANWLSARPQASVADIREVEMALAARERRDLQAELRAERSVAELEAQMERQEQEAAYESLYSLEPHLHRRAGQPVRRHARRKPFYK